MHDVSGAVSVSARNIVNDASRGLIAERASVANNRAANPRVAGDAAVDAHLKNDGEREPGSARPVSPEHDSNHTKSGVQ